MARCENHRLAEAPSVAGLLLRRCDRGLAAVDHVRRVAFVSQPTFRYTIEHIRWWELLHAAARRKITRARELGPSVMAGCMTEATVGISALAQLLPLLDHIDMDGAVLLARDVATGVRLERGRCIFPAVNGTGVELRWSADIALR